MTNVKMKVEDGKLLIEVDLTEEHGKSKSGKSITIASTQGNKPVPNTNAMIGLNVYKKV